MWVAMKWKPEPCSGLCNATHFTVFVLVSAAAHILFITDNRLIWCEKWSSRCTQLDWHWFTHRPHANFSPPSADQFWLVVRVCPGETFLPCSQREEGIIWGQKVAGDDSRNLPAVCCWGQFAVFLTQAGNTAKCSCFSEHTRHTPSFTHTFVQLFLLGHCFDFIVQPIPYLWPTPTSACLSSVTFCHLNITVIHLYIFIFLPCVLCHCRGKPDAHKVRPHENYWLQ